MNDRYADLYGGLRAALLARCFAVSPFFRQNLFQEISPIAWGDDAQLLAASSPEEQVVQRWNKQDWARGNTNPLGFGGLLMICLAIEARLGRADSLRALEAALATLRSLHKFAGNDFDGYLLRYDAVTNGGWKQLPSALGGDFPPGHLQRYSTAVPVGQDGRYSYCPPLNDLRYVRPRAGDYDYASGDRYRWMSYCRAAEPSQDELHGLIAGYDVAFRLVADAAVRDEIARQAGGLAGYLAAHGYFLVRPVGGLAGNGEALRLEFPAGRVFQRICGGAPGAYSSRVDFEGAMRQAGIWPYLEGPLQWATIAGVAWSAVISFFPASAALSRWIPGGPIGQGIAAARAVAIATNPGCFDLWSEEYAKTLGFSYLLSLMTPADRFQFNMAAVAAFPSSPPAGFPPFLGITAVDDADTTVRDAYLAWMRAREADVRNDPAAAPFGARSLFARAVAMLLGAGLPDEAARAALFRERLAERWNVLSGSVHALHELVWMGDTLPPGATPIGDADGWTWIPDATTPWGPQLVHLSPSNPGMHQHFFENAQPFSLAGAPILYAYVRLDAGNPPQEIMLQWRGQNDAAGTWDHRAYWGKDLLGWGTAGSPSRRYVGDLPPAGAWFRLSIPADAVGLAGASVTAMAFTLFGGSATWGRAGGSPDIVWAGNGQLPLLDTIDLADHGSIVHSTAEAALPALDYMCGLAVAWWYLQRGPSAGVLPSDFPAMPDVAALPKAVVPATVLAAAWKGDLALPLDALRAGPLDPTADVDLFADLVERSPEPFPLVPRAAANLRVDNLVVVRGTGDVDTGVVLQNGEELEIEAAGFMAVDGVSFGPNGISPAQYDLSYPYHGFPNAFTRALLGFIHDYFLIGGGVPRTRYLADTDLDGDGTSGSLKLRVNDPDPTRAVQGELQVRVRVWGPPEQPKAIFVSQNVSTEMFAGQPYAVQVTYANAGPDPWTVIGGPSDGGPPPLDDWSRLFYLSATDPQANWSPSRVKLAAAVQPGGLAEFRFSIVAPSAPGVYLFQWGVMHGGAWVDPGSLSPPLPIHVAQAPQRTRATVTIQGAEQSLPIPASPGIAGSGGAITIAGVEGSRLSTEPGPTGKPVRVRVFDAGTVSLTIGGRTVAVTYGSVSSAGSVASALASAINADPGALVTAALAGAAVSFTAKATGAATNYPVTVSSASMEGFSPPSFAGSPAATALAGGADGSAGPSTLYDTGSISITVNGHTNLVTYGRDSTAATAAIALAAAINGDRSAFVTATSAGNVLTVLAKQIGNLAYPISSSSAYDQAHFRAPSYVALPSAANLQ